MAANQGPTMMRNFKFSVSIDGSPVGSVGFSEVSGFDATYDVAEYRAGDDAFLTPRKFPGLVKYGNITLKRGVIGTEDTGFMTWLSANISGAMQKKSMTITLEDPAGTATAVWNIREAWAVKYTGPDLNGNASEIAVETIEVAHEGIDFNGIGGPAR